VRDEDGPYSISARGLFMKWRGKTTAFFWYAFVSRRHEFSLERQLMNVIKSRVFNCGTKFERCFLDGSWREIASAIGCY
jgi:hypothetical protein